MLLELCVALWWEVLFKVDVVWDTKDSVNIKFFLVSSFQVKSVFFKVRISKRSFRFNQFLSHLCSHSYNRLFCRFFIPLYSYQLILQPSCIYLGRSLVLWRYVHLSLLEVICCWNILIGCVKYIIICERALLFYMIKLEPRPIIASVGLCESSYADFNKVLFFILFNRLK